MIAVQKSTANITHYQNYYCQKFTAISSGYISRLKTCLLNTVLSFDINWHRSSLICKRRTVRTINAYGDDALMLMMMSNNFNDKISHCNCLTVCGIVDSADEEQQLNRYVCSSTTG